MTDVRIWRRRVVSLCLVVVVILAGAVASLGGDPNVCYAVADSGNFLVSINKTTGANTLIGQTGANNIEAVAFRPGGDVLYAADAGQLGTLNLSTGEFASTSSPVGSGGGSDGEASFDEVDGLTFDASSGVLHGSVKRPGPDLLIQISPTTGARIAEAFGPGQDYVVVDGPGFHDTIDDIAIDPLDGQMYGVDNTGGSGSDQLVRINKSTGAGTVVGPTGVEDMGGLGFFDDGTLYGSTGLSSPPSQRDRLWTISKSSGNAVFVHSFTEHTDYEALDCLTASQNNSGESDAGNDVGPAANDPPTAVDDRTTTGATPVTITVLENDSDPEGQALTVTAVTSPSSGTAVINADNTITYTPSAGFTGTDSFDYTITDPEGGTGTATVGVTVTEFTLRTTDSPDPVHAGEQVTYTISVENTGPSSQDEVTVSDTLPAGFTVASVSSSQGGCPSLPCSLGTVLSGGTATVRVVANVAPGVPAGYYPNSATVQSQGLAPSSVTELTRVSEAARLTIAITDSPDPVFAGEAVSYTVTVGNSGPSNADVVTVGDVLPAGFSVEGISASQGGCSALPCTLGTLPPGVSATVVIVARVGAGVPAGSYPNTATATSDEAAAVSAGETTEVKESAILTIALTDSADPVSPGGEVIYTVTVDNNGPSNADNLTVTNTLPRPFAVFGVSSSQGSCAALPCNLGTLAPKETATVAIVASVASGAAPGIYTSQSGADSDGDTVSVTELTQVTNRADLSIVKADDPDPVSAGAKLVYTVTASNAGPDAATNVQFEDTLPNGTTFMSISPSTGCTTSGRTISCQSGTIDAGASLSWMIEVLVDKAGGAIRDGSVLENTANISSDEVNPRRSDDRVVETTTVVAPDLTLTKSAEPPDGSEVTTGETIVFTIQYTNSGSGPATNSQISDSVAPEFGEVTPSDGGTFDPVTRLITWNVGTVDPSSTGSVSFTARVGALEDLGQIKNQACGTASELLSSTCSDTTMHKPVRSEVLITKGADRAENSEVRVFDVVTYELSIQSRGRRAFGFVVTDEPPQHMNYVAGSTRVDGTLVEDSGGTSPLFSGGVSLTVERNETRSITFQMSVDPSAPAGSPLQNWGHATWEGGTSGDFFDLKVHRPRAGPSLRQTILVEGPEGQIIFVTVFKQVLNVLPVTGYQSLVLGLLALSALGVGTSFSSPILPSLFRTLDGRTQRDRRRSVGRES